MNLDLKHSYCLTRWADEMYDSQPEGYWLSLEAFMGGSLILGYEPEISYNNE